MSEDVLKKVEYLAQTKELIKEALREQGSDIRDEDAFRVYAEKILNLKTGSGDDVVKVRTGERGALALQDSKTEMF